MEEKNQFRPIELIDTKIITHKGYYDCEITNFKHEKVGLKQKMGVSFRVIKGKHAGFNLTTYFYDTYRSKARLTHLCNSVGIYGQLSDPNELVGKRLKLRIVPKYLNYQGRTYLEHRITRFHSINRKI